MIARLGRLACDCRTLFGPTGYAHVDLQVDDRDKPWILEVNENPCLPPYTGLMAAAAREFK